jgi:Asp-tRNA(Asn)/Glu-tRNA(Gln) amidotransferase B subunit
MAWTGCADRVTREDAMAREATKRVVDAPGPEMNSDEMRLRELCKSFMERSTALIYKGKKRETAAMDYFVGAVAGAKLAGKEDFAEHIGRWVVMLLRPRGYSEVERLAKGE